MNSLKGLNMLQEKPYRYTFTEPAELLKTGHWWNRDFIEYYLLPIGIAKQPLGR